MCLSVNPIMTKQFKIYCKRKNIKEIVVWKVLEKCRSLTDNKVLYRSIFGGFNDIKAGWLKADGSLSKSGSIDTGAIHVLRTRELARNFHRPGEIIIRCRALIKDFIATNGCQDEMCFKKIWIPKSELKR